MTEFQQQTNGKPLTAQSRGARFPLSLDDWQQQGRRADAIRLGLIKSYGEVDGQPVYRPTAELVRLKTYLARRTPEIAEQKWLAYRSSATPGDARSLLARWLQEDPGAVVPGPPPPSVRARRRPTEEERALGRNALDDLVDAGLLEIAGICPDGEPIYRKAPELSDSEFAARMEQRRAERADRLAELFEEGLDATAR